jgi:hypothetical protein
MHCYRQVLVGGSVFVRYALLREQLSDANLTEGFSSPQL